MKEMMAILRSCVAVGLLILLAVLISILTPASESAAQGGQTPCPHCGGQNTPEARFCTHCGTRLAEV